MKNIIIATDSFKGTLSSIEASKAMSEAILEVFPECEIVSVPVADGGEGSVDAFLAANGGSKVEVASFGPNMTPVTSAYGILKDGITAVVEMAAAAGLPMAKEGSTPDLTTTYGVGLLVKDAIEKGCRKVIMCLGGSATNDGGCGMAAALGAEFIPEDTESILTDASGRFVPTGGTLSKIKEVNLTELKKAVQGVEFLTMCDINNPLYGENGAAYIFGPQKGADEAMVKVLDQNLRAFSGCMADVLGTDYSLVPGAGAAGGMGFGMVAFFDSKLQMGIDTVLEQAGYQKLLKKADLVLTGEGKMDGQTVQGKAISGIARYAKEADVPVIAIVGCIGGNSEALYEIGLSAVFATNFSGLPFSQLAPRAYEDLKLTTKNVMRTIKYAKKQA